MTQFQKLLRIEYQLYRYMVERSPKENSEIIDSLLKEERTIFENMTQEEVLSSIRRLQKVYLSSNLEENQILIFTRLAKQLTYLDRYFEMQESSSFSIAQMKLLGLDFYAQHVLDDLLFYERFHRSVHQNLEPSKIYDYLYSYFYMNVEQLQSRKGSFLKEEDFFYHEECSSLLLEDFSDYCEAMIQDPDSNKTIVESYLKLFPSSFAPYLYKTSSHFKEQKELENILCLHGFDKKMKPIKNLCCYSPHHHFDYFEFRKYHDWMEKIQKTSQPVLSYLKNVFYQLNHGTKEDVEDSYVYLLNQVMKEEKLISQLIPSLDELRNFKSYIITTQLGDNPLFLPFLISFFGEENELSENFFPVLFGNRLITKLTQRENQLMNDDFMLDDENRYYDEQIYRLEDIQQLMLEYIKKEIDLDEFIEDLADLEETKEIYPHYMVDLNFVDQLLQFLEHQIVSSKRKEQLTSACSCLIYLHACERDAILGEFKHIKSYSYQDSKKFSSNFREEYEDIPLPQVKKGIYPYLRYLYKRGIYEMLSDSDKKRLQLARRENV